MTLLNGFFTSGFSPANISGGLGWYDASVTPAGAVASWTDQFNIAGPSTQATSGKQPVCTANQLNGKKSLLFASASSQTLALPSAVYSIANGANASFIVAKRNSETGSENTLIGTNNTTSSNIRYYISLTASSGGLYFQSKSTNGSGVNVAGLTNTNYQIITTLRSGTTESVQINNGTPTTNTNGITDNTSTIAYIGSNIDVSNYLNGGMAEMILYKKVPTAAEIILLNKYLSAKWGIAIS